MTPAKPSADDIQQCECGSTHYRICRDGVLECAECGHPDGDRMAVKRDLRKWAKKNGVKIKPAEARA